MKNSVKNKLESSLQIMLNKVNESDFDPENNTWHLNNSKRIESIEKSWRNIVKNYRKYYDNKQEFELDLNLFSYELRAMETKYILKHLYGAEAAFRDIFNIIVMKNETAQETAVKIINSLKYEIL